ncbi:MAG: TetR/AcrR family transcriptional regulator [Coriobacteriia bacterium]|nr:TetR/AcrR family transcriptional regulator [Coriobacteriia bacterium]
MDDSGCNIGPIIGDSIDLQDEKIPTSLRIRYCAVELFADRGYTETSMRSIALAVGVNAATIYGHYASKEALLLSILDDLGEHIQYMFSNPEMYNIIKANPTVEGLMTCWETSISIMANPYYLNVLNLIMHEQHRIPVVREMVLKVLFECEEYVVEMFEILKELHVIREDADSDFWKKNISSIVNIAPIRRMINLEESPDVPAGKDLINLINSVFEIALLVLKPKSAIDS